MGGPEEGAGRDGEGSEPAVEMTDRQAGWRRGREWMRSGNENVSISIMR